MGYLHQPKYKLYQVLALVAVRSNQRSLINVRPGLVHGALYSDDLHFMDDTPAFLQVDRLYTPSEGAELLICELSIGPPFLHGMLTVLLWHCPPDSKDGQRENFPLWELARNE